MNALTTVLMMVQVFNPSMSATLPNTLIGFFEKTEEFRETYTVSPGTELQIENANGDIKISQWTEDYVEVHAKKKTNYGEEELAKVNIEVVVNGTMRIRTKYLEKNVHVSVTYAIRVPKDVVVQKVRTSNGEIEVNGTRGDVEALTSNGEIDLKNIRGAVSANTSNGEIEIKGTTAVVKANTSNGEVRVEIHTVPEAGTEISTSNGSIHVYIVDDLNADLMAATSRGRVHMEDLSLQSRFKVASVSSTVLVGEIGEGGRSLNISTSNGEIGLYRTSK